MKKNIFKVLLVAILIFGLGVSFMVQAVNIRVSCQNGVCLSMGDDLPDGPTDGISPNTTVNLSFSVYQENGVLPPDCAVGKKLFNAVRHNIDGNADRWEYVKDGVGQDIEWTFNSGQGGQRNRYSGVFYCWTSSQGTFKDNVDLTLGLLDTQNPKQAWLTPELNLNTRIAPQLPVSEKPERQTSGKTTSLNFSNPLGAESFVELIQDIQQWLIYLAIPMAAVVIVISGVWMMAASGDPGKFGQAKKMLLWTVIGLVVVLIGEGFLKLIESIINLKNR